MSLVKPKEFDEASGGFDDWVDAIVRIYEIGIRAGTGGEGAGRCF